MKYKVFEIPLVDMHWGGNGGLEDWVNSIASQGYKLIAVWERYFIFQAIEQLESER